VILILGQKGESGGTLESNFEGWVILYPGHIFELFPITTIVTTRNQPLGSIRYHSSCNWYNLIPNGVYMRELGIPFIYKEREVRVREVFHMRVYEVYSFIHLVPTTYHIQLVIVCLYQSQRFTMESPCGASNNVLKPRSNN
jgi:hypothetical protein